MSNDIFDTPYDAPLEAPDDSELIKQWQKDIAEEGERVRLTGHLPNYGQEFAEAVDMLARLEKESTAFRHWGVEAHVEMARLRDWIERAKEELSVELGACDCTEQDGMRCSGCGVKMRLIAEAEGAGDE